MSSSKRELIDQQKTFYDNRWKHSSLGPVEAERIGFIVSAIPPDCGRLLDVGCGDGRVSRQLGERQTLTIVAFDLSTVALVNAGGLKCGGSADQLPFIDQSFDLVLSTEILEHIPEAIYPQVLGELARVSRRYILVTVPNEEDLNESTARCGSCGASFHVWGHLRSYRLRMLKTLFPGFKALRLIPFGESVGRYSPFLLWVRQHIAGTWFWENHTRCYRCHGTTPATPRFPLLTRVCDALSVRVWQRFSRRRSWVLGLYERQTEGALGVPRC